MKKILIVDDEPEICSLLTQIIELSGDFKIVSEANGKEGFITYKSFQPDLIISDYKMPICNGSEFHSKVRSIDKSTPFIIMSGYTEEPASKINMDNHTRIIKKPDDIKIIIEIVSEILTSNGRG